MKNLKWYWWLIIVLVIVGIIYFVFVDKFFGFDKNLYNIIIKTINTKIKNQYFCKNFVILCNISSCF